MTDQAHRATPTFRLASVLVALFGVALLVVSIRQAGWDNIVKGISSVGGWLVAAILLGAARMALRAGAWTVCSRAQDPAGIPFREAYAATLAADAMGNLTPLGLFASEPMKVMLARRHVSTVASLSSVAVENAFYTASVAAMLVGGIWILLRTVNVSPAVERLGTVIAGVTLVVGLVAFWMLRTRPAVLSWLWEFVTRGRSRHSVETIAAFESNVYDVAHWPWTRLAHVVALEALFHVAAVTEVFLILRALPGGGAVTVADAFVMEATGRLITVAFKFIPYRLGVDEIGSGSVSELLGLGTAAGVTLALVRRVRIFVLNAVGVWILARGRGSLGRGPGLAK